MGVGVQGGGRGISCHAAKTQGPPGGGGGGGGAEHIDSPSADVCALANHNWEGMAAAAATMSAIVQSLGMTLAISSVSVRCRVPEGFNFVSRLSVVDRFALSQRCHTHGDLPEDQQRNRSRERKALACIT